MLPADSVSFFLENLNFSLYFYWIFTRILRFGVLVFFQILGKVPPKKESPLGLLGVNFANGFFSQAPQAWGLDIKSRSRDVSGWNSSCL